MPTYTPVDPLPTAPSRKRPAAFSSEADDFLAKLPEWGQQVSDLGVLSVNASIAAIEAAAVAVAAVDATQWVSGTTYALNAMVWSPVNGLVYRRIVAGSGTTDPSADSTNWAIHNKTLVPYSGRTSNAELGPLNNGTFIDITSGTFTQTFASADLLGAGWRVLIRNAGTGDITLDPYGTNTIDERSSFVMYPGEAREIFCDGLVLRSIVRSSFYRVWTASGTFIKPPGYAAFKGLLWGGGAGGGRSGSISTAAYGGGGAGCFPFDIPSAMFGSSETVTIGSGGAAVTGTTAAGTTGGNSSLGALIAANGGRTSGGGGGTDDPVAHPEGFTGSIVGATSKAVYGGAGASSPTIPSGVAGSSAYGGAGGASLTSAASPGVAGTSNIGGNGGSASSAGDGVAGSIPGGGGGATQTGTQSGAGGRGELRMWGTI